MDHRTVDRRTFLKTIGTSASCVFTGWTILKAVAEAKDKLSVIMIYADALDFKMFPFRHSAVLHTFGGFNRKF